MTWQYWIFTDFRVGTHGQDLDSYQVITIYGFIYVLKVASKKKRGCYANSGIRPTTLS